MIIFVGRKKVGVTRSDFNKSDVGQSFIARIKPNGAQVDENFSSHKVTIVHVPDDNTLVVKL